MSADASPLVLQAATGVAIGLLVYGAIGALVALACLGIGPRAWPQAPGPMTWPARLLVVPGAVLLWPWLAWQWRARARRNP